MTAEATRVTIPADLREACEDRIEGTNFESVEEYVQFVVAEVLEDGTDDGQSRERTENDDAVTDRLESLGYL